MVRQFKLYLLVFLLSLKTTHLNLTNQQAGTFIILNMDVFKIPQIPSSTRCKSVLSKEGIVVTPERPPVPSSPGVWQDLDELIQEELPESQGNLEGWGSLSPEKEPSVQERNHTALLSAIGLEKEELDKIYNYTGDKWKEHLQKLTPWQQIGVKQCRLQYKNGKSAAASRKKKGRELDLIRKLLDEKKRQRESHRAKNKQLKVRLQQVKAKKEALVRAINEKNPGALDPVNQGFCTLEEFLKAKKEALERAISEKNPGALDPVNQGFCTLGEFLDWFHPGN